VTEARWKGPFGPVGVFRRFQLDADNLSRSTERKKKLPILSLLAAAVVVGLIVVAVFGGRIAPQDPNAVNLEAIDAGPSWAHWFGADDLGRDLFSRVLVGARLSLGGPLIVDVSSIILGSALAILAVWFGGLLDSGLSRVVEAMFAFPGLLLAILAAALIGPGLTAPVVALVVAYTPYAARVVRSAALRERELPYIRALEVQGISGFRICTRHLLPNLSSLILTQATLSFGYALIDLAAVSYLGLGVAPPASDWGEMVSSGQSGILEGHPEQSLFAGGAIVLTVCALNVLGAQLSARGRAS
jgi:peptide/nickel transport system permease protein